MLVDIRRVWAGNRPEWLDRHCQTQWTVRRAVSISLSFLLGLCRRVYERVSRIWFEREEVFFGFYPVNLYLTPNVVYVHNASSSVKCT